jgi:hypothetical protein
MKVPSSYVDVSAGIAVSVHSGVLQQDVPPLILTFPAA